MYVIGSEVSQHDQPGRGTSPEATDQEWPCHAPLSFIADSDAFHNPLTLVFAHNAMISILHTHQYILRYATTSRLV